MGGIENQGVGQADDDDDLCLPSKLYGTTLNVTTNINGYIYIKEYGMGCCYLVLYVVQMKGTPQKTWSLK